MNKLKTYNEREKKIDVALFVISHLQHARPVKSSWFVFKSIFLNITIIFPA